MNPFSEFNHFIGYFLPGVVLFVLSLVISSLVAGQDWLSISFLSALVKGHFFAILIASTILGLLVDGVRHLFDEKVFEEPWARREGLNWEEVDDFVTYIPRISVDHYKLIRDESFYFYEFYVNLGMVVVIGAVFVPIYLDRFCKLGAHSLGALSLVFLGLVALGALCWWLGKDAYEYFLDTFISTMERLDPGFEKTIALKKEK